MADEELDQRKLSRQTWGWNALNHSFSLVSRWVFVLIPVDLSDTDDIALHAVVESFPDLSTKLKILGRVPPHIAARVLAYYAPAVRVQILLAKTPILQSIGNALSCLSSEEFQETIAAAQEKDKSHLRLAYLAGSKRIRGSRWLFLLVGGCVRSRGS